MMNKIKERVPEKFFIIVDSMAKDPKIAKRLTSTDQIKMVYELTQNVIANDLKEEDLEALKKPIDRSDVETVDYLEILEDFSVRIQDKLDLAILNKQIYSVFENSEVLKKNWCFNMQRKWKTKKSRSRICIRFYVFTNTIWESRDAISNSHEHKEGNYGYAAHNAIQGKGFKEFEIPPRSDREKIAEFRTCVEFVSPKKFLAQFDNAEADRIVTQVFGK